VRSLGRRFRRPLRDTQHSGYRCLCGDVMRKGVGLVGKGDRKMSQASSLDKSASVAALSAVFIEPIGLPMTTHDRSPWSALMPGAGDFQRPGCLLAPAKSASGGAGILTANGCEDSNHGFHVLVFERSKTAARRIVEALPWFS
jgi:hypothetical protein